MKIANPNKHPRLALYMTGETNHVIGHNLTEIVVDENVTVQVRTMVAPTIEHMSWIDGIMREHLPPTIKTKPVTVEAAISQHGWPVVFAHYQIFDEKGAPLEERAGVFYRIVHNHAEVVVRLKNGVRWSDRAAELKPHIMSAHVNWPNFENDLLYTLLGFEL